MPRSATKLDKIHASNWQARASRDNNDLDDVCPMDEDEHLEYADQEHLSFPIPGPTSTGVLGQMAKFKFLLDLPDFQLEIM